MRNKQRQLHLVTFMDLEMDVIMVRYPMHNFLPLQRTDIVSALITVQSFNIFLALSLTSVFCGEKIDRSTATGIQYFFAVSGFGIVIIVDSVIVTAYRGIC